MLLLVVMMGGWEAVRGGRGGRDEAPSVQLCGCADGAKVQGGESVPGDVASVRHHHVLQVELVGLWLHMLVDSRTFSPLWILVLGSWGSPLSGCP